MACTCAGSKAVFEIYKRINSGGENLNDQQARKAAFWCGPTCSSPAATDAEIMLSHRPSHSEPRSKSHRRLYGVICTLGGSNEETGIHCGAQKPS